MEITNKMTEYKTDKYTFVIERRGADEIGDKLTISVFDDKNNLLNTFHDWETIKALIELLQVADK